MIQRIVTHPEFDKRLFWLADASDADLQFLYKHAQALVYPSIAEGFGLPLVEAGHYTLPVIASDIPVFREIAGDQINYFEVANPEELFITIMKSLNGEISTGIAEVVSWDSSAKTLISIIRTDGYQLKTADMGTVDFPNVPMRSFGI